MDELLTDCLGEEDDDGQIEYIRKLYYEFIISVDDKFKWTRKKRNKTCNFEFINMAYYFSIADSNKIDLHILKIYIKENRK